MERRFEGKVALVTGAATGMGQATAARLAADGATVAVNHLPGQDPGETLARITKANGQGFAFPTDMRDPDQVTAMVHGVAERAGRLDYVVSNAGINPTLTWDETSVEDFNRLFETNVRGTTASASAEPRYVVSRYSLTGSRIWRALRIHFAMTCSVLGAPVLPHITHGVVDLAVPVTAESLRLRRTSSGRRNTGHAGTSARLEVSTG
jgi:NAD(P)-dependent dehydrogenase (short-subunit alcohol dehydrogenase family)